MSAIPIAFCITELDPGGAERALVRIVLGLDRARWKPHVYCLSARGVMADSLENGGIPVTCLGAGPRDVGVIWRLASQLKRDPPALLQTFLLHANIAGCLAGKIAGIPHIVTGIRVAERRGGWRLRLERWAGRFAEMHVCVSQGVADFSAREGHLASDKLVVIPNGVDVARFESAAKGDVRAFGIPEDAPTVITVGRLDPQKGLTVLLKAWPDIANQVPAAHLFIVGEGPQRAGLERATNLMGCDRIHFAGYRDDIPELLRASQVLALPSMWEGMPNAVLEAMAAGLPVVASRVEGTAELVEDGVTGYLIPPGNADALASRLTQLLLDQKSARDMGHSGQLRVRAEFTWERVIQAYSELYEGLLATRGKSQA